MGRMSVIEAKRYRRVGQGAAAVLAVSAAGLWAFTVPMLAPSLPPPPKPVAAPIVKAASANDGPTLGRQALAETANRLVIGSNVMQPAAPATQIAKVEPPTAAGPEWQYLGEIREPDRRLALVSVDGAQRVLAEGRAYGELRLVSVGPDEITVRGGSGVQRIARSERSDSSPRVAWVRDMPANAPPATMNPATAKAVALQQQMINQARGRGYRTFREREMQRRGRGMGAGYPPRG